MNKKIIHWVRASCDNIFEETGKMDSVHSAGRSEKKTLEHIRVWRDVWDKIGVEIKRMVKGLTVEMDVRLIDLIKKK